MKKTNKQGRLFRSPQRKIRDKAFADWIGKKVKEARKESELSPETFAEEKLEVSIHAYHKLTSGQSSLSEGRIHEICEQIGLQYEVFIGGEKFIYPNDK